MQVSSDGSQAPVSFRYAVSVKDTINAYRPRDLEANIDKQNLRSSVFGAIWSKKFTQLPSTDFCRVVWEAGNWNLCHGLFRKIQYLALKAQQGSNPI
jgi:hypothetical protein